MLPSASRSRKRSKRTRYNPRGNLAFSLTMRLPKRFSSLVPLYLILTLSLSFPRKPPQTKTPFSSQYSSTSDLTTVPLTLWTVFYPSAPFRIIARETTWTATTKDDVRVSLYSFFSPHGFDDYDDASERRRRVERFVRSGWAGGGNGPGVSNRSDHFLLSVALRPHSFLSLVLKWYIRKK